MFESLEVQVGGGPAAETATECASALAAVVIEQRRAGARRLALAAQWADLHDPYRRHSRFTGVRSREVGAEGTPSVAEFAITELGMLLETSTMSAHCLLRDALELRHRMPHLWQAVMTGRVEDWKARKIAAATRVLSWAHALEVDTQTTEQIIGLPFSRAIAVVEGAVVAVDPAGHEARRAAAAREQYVSLTRREDTHGLRTLVARGTAADMHRLQAVVDHLAALLAQAGDDAPAGIRRAKALALLAEPARACLFLADTAAHLEDEPPIEETPAPVRRWAPPEELLKAWALVPAEVLDPARRLGELLRSLGEEVLDRLRPTSVLHLHLAAEGPRVVRTEQLGPISLVQLQEILGTHRVTVAPVLDPLGVTPVDSYEIPTRLRKAITSLHPFEVFPYGTTPTRSADLDHTIPYRPGPDRPPGQTRRENLGPLGRHHHRAKTFGDFTMLQPLPGLYLWRTPTGHWYRVDHRGTTALGTQTPEILRPTKSSPMDTAFTDLILDLAA